jgi:hypothetical protein
MNKLRNKFLNAKHNARRVFNYNRFRNNVNRKLDYNFRSSPQTYGPGYTTINIDSEIVQNFTAIGYYYVDLQYIFNNSEEFNQLKSMYELVKLKQIRIIVFPDDNANNDNTYINLDWFQKVSTNIKTCDWTKVVYNDRKRRVSFNFIPLNMNIKDLIQNQDRYDYISVNPRQYQLTDDFKMPGRFVIHPTAPTNFRARIIIRVEFRRPIAAESSRIVLNELDRNNNTFKNRLIKSGVLTNIVTSSDLGIQPSGKFDPGDHKLIKRDKVDKFENLSISNLNESFVSNNSNNSNKTSPNFKLCKVDQIHVENIPQKNDLQGSTMELPRFYKNKKEKNNGLLIKELFDVKYKNIKDIVDVLQKIGSFKRVKEGYNIFMKLPIEKKYQQIDNVLRQFKEVLQEELQYIQV